MHKTSPLILVAFVLVALATGFVMFSPEPELTRVGSNDEMIFVSGYSRSALPFTIAVEPGADNSVLRGSRYQIEPSGITLERPATIRMMFTGLTPLLSKEGQGEVLNLLPYRFDDLLQMWEEVAPITDRTETYLEVETKQLGNFSLGLAPAADQPNFNSAYQQLLTMAPAGTVGYEIATGYQALETDPIIRLIDGTEIGGCGGVVGQGNREERSRIAVGNFIYLARWFVSDLHTCPQDRPLAAYPNVVE